MIKANWQLNDDLHWQSDWDGSEVGYDDVLVVGLYQLRDTDVYFYIDMENLVILEYMTFSDY